MSKPNQQGTQAQTEFKKRRQRRRVQREPGDQAAANKQSVDPGVATLNAFRSRAATLRRAEDAERGGNGGQPNLAFDAGMLFEGGTVEAQAEVLQRLDGTQRRQAIRRIARVQGNRHVQRVVAAYGGNGQGRVSPPVAVQTKLEVSEPGDEYEQEADTVADQVMLMPAAPPPDETPAGGAGGGNGVSGGAGAPFGGELSLWDLLGRDMGMAMLFEGEAASSSMGRKANRCTGGDCLAEAALLKSNVQRQEEKAAGALHRQRKPNRCTTPDCRGEATLLKQETRRWASQEATSEVAPDLEERVRALQGRGAPLSEGERAFFEPRLGRDLSQVRIHADGEAADLSQDLGARAFALGGDIAFGEGEFRPGTEEGRRLMAHELAHVVQQGAAEPLEDTSSSDDQAVQEQQPTEGDGQAASGTDAKEAAGEAAKTQEDKASPASVEGKQQPVSMDKTLSPVAEESLVSVEEASAAGAYVEEQKESLEKTLSERAEPLAAAHEALGTLPLGKAAGILKGQASQVPQTELRLPLGVPTMEQVGKEPVREQASEVVDGVRQETERPQTVKEAEVDGFQALSSQVSGSQVVPSGGMVDRAGVAVPEGAAGEADLAQNPAFESKTYRRRSQGQRRGLTDAGGRPNLDVSRGYRSVELGQQRAAAGVQVGTQAAETEAITRADYGQHAIYPTEEGQAIALEGEASGEGVTGSLEAATEFVEEVVEAEVGDGTADVENDPDALCREDWEKRQEELEEEEAALEAEKERLAEEEEEHEVGEKRIVREQKDTQARALALRQQGAAQERERQELRDRQLALNAQRRELARQEKEAEGGNPALAAQKAQLAAQGAQLRGQKVRLKQARRQRVRRQKRTRTQEVGLREKENRHETYGEGLEERFAGHEEREAWLEEAWQALEEEMAAGCQRGKGGGGGGGGGAAAAAMAADEAALAAQAAALEKERQELEARRALLAEQVEYDAAAVMATAVAENDALLASFANLSTLIDAEAQADIAKILTDAETESKAILDKAEADAEARQKQGEKDAEQAIKSAQAEAAGLEDGEDPGPILARGQAQARQILAAMQRDVDHIIQTGQDDVQKRLQEAEVAAGVRTEVAATDQDVLAQDTADESVAIADQASTDVGTVVDEGVQELDAEIAACDARMQDVMDVEMPGTAMLEEMDPAAYGEPAYSGYGPDYVAPPEPPVPATPPPDYVYYMNVYGTGGGAPGIAAEEPPLYVSDYSTDFDVSISATEVYDGTVTADTGWPAVTGYPETVVSGPDTQPPRQGGGGPGEEDGPLPGGTGTPTPTATPTATPPAATPEPWGPATPPVTSTPSVTPTPTATSTVPYEPTPYLDSPVIAVPPEQQPVANQVYNRMQGAWNGFTDEQRENMPAKEQAALLIASVQGIEALQVPEPYRPTTSMDMNQKRVHVMVDAVQYIEGLPEEVRVEVIRQAAGYDVEEAGDIVGQTIGGAEFQDLHPVEQAEALAEAMHDVPGFDILPPVEKAQAMAELVNQMEDVPPAVKNMTAMTMMHEIEGEVTLDLLGAIDTTGESSWPVNQDIVAARQAELEQLAFMHKVMASDFTAQMTGLTREERAQMLYDLNNQIDAGLKSITDFSAMTREWADSDATYRGGIAPGARESLPRPDMPGEMAGHLMSALHTFGVSDPEMATDILGSVMPSRPDLGRGSRLESMSRDLGLVAPEGEVQTVLEAIDGLAEPSSFDIDAVEISEDYAWQMAVEGRLPEDQAGELMVELRDMPSFEDMPPAEQAVAAIRVIENIPDLPRDVRDDMSMAVLGQLEQEAMSRVVSETGQNPADYDTKKMQSAVQDIEALTNVHKAVASASISYRIDVSPQLRAEMTEKMCSRLDEGYEDIQTFVHQAQNLNERVLRESGGNIELARTLANQKTASDTNSLQYVLSNLWDAARTFGVEGDVKVQDKLIDLTTAYPHWNQYEVSERDWFKDHPQNSVADDWDIVQATLNGDPIVQQVTDIGNIIDGLESGGEEQVMALLRYSADSGKDVNEWYRKVHGVDLVTALGKQYGFDDSDQQRVEALLEGDLARADAIAVEQALKDKDEQAIEAIYATVRTEVEMANPLASSAEIDAMVLARNMEIEQAYSQLQLEEQAEEKGWNEQELAGHILENNKQIEHTYSRQMLEGMAEAQGWSEAELEQAVLSNAALIEVGYNDLLLAKEAEAEGWTDGELQKARDEGNTALIGAVYEGGLEGLPGGVMADLPLQHAFESRFSGAELDLVKGWATNDMTAVDAARIQLSSEGKWFLNKENDAVIESLRNPYRRAQADVYRDKVAELREQGLTGYELMERAAQIQMELSTPGSELYDQVEARAGQNMAALEATYEQEYDKTLRDAINQDMLDIPETEVLGTEVVDLGTAWTRDRREMALELLEGDGQLSPEQEIHYAIAGWGTDADVLYQVVMSEDTEALKMAYQDRYGKSLVEDMDGLSGWDEYGFEIDYVLENGVPQTREEKLTFLEGRVDHYTEKGGLAREFAQDEATVLRHTYQEAALVNQRLEGLDPNSPEAQVLKDQFDQLVADASGDIVQYRYKVDDVTNKAVTAVTLTLLAATVILTAGPGAGILSTLAQGSTTAEVLLTGAMYASSPLAAMATKTAMKGEHYFDLSNDEFRGDVLSLPADVLMGYATGKMGDKLIGTKVLSELADEGGAWRLGAYAIAEGGENLAQEQLGSLVRTMATNETWTQGNFLRNIAEAQGSQAVQSVVMGGLFGAPMRALRTGLPGTRGGVVDDGPATRTGWMGGEMPDGAKFSTTYKADTALTHTVVSPDGHVVTEVLTTDGMLLVVDRSGGQVRIDPIGDETGRSVDLAIEDGRVMIYNENGVVTILEPDGTRVDDMAAVLETGRTDLGLGIDSPVQGVKMVSSPDGVKTTIDFAGDTQGEFGADGVFRIDQEGVSVQTAADGSFTYYRDGEIVARQGSDGVVNVPGADGSVTRIGPDGQVTQIKIDAEEGTTIIRPDGTQETVPPLEVGFENAQVDAVWQEKLDRIAAMPDADPLAKLEAMESMRKDMLVAEAIMSDEAYAAGCTPEQLQADVARIKALHGDKVDAWLAAPDATQRALMKHDLGEDVEQFMALDESRRALVDHYPDALSIRPDLRQRFMSGDLDSAELTRLESDLEIAQAFRGDLDGDHRELFDQLFDPSKAADQRREIAADLFNKIAPDLGALVGPDGDFELAGKWLQGSLEARFRFGNETLDSYTDIDAYLRNIDESDNPLEALARFRNASDEIAVKMADFDPALDSEFGQAFLDVTGLDKEEVDWVQTAMADLQNPDKNWDEVVKEMYELAPEGSAVAENFRQKFLIPYEAASPDMKAYMRDAFLQGGFLPQHAQGLKMMSEGLDMTIAFRQTNPTAGMWGLMGIPGKPGHYGFGEQVVQAGAMDAGVYEEVMIRLGDQHPDWSEDQILAAVSGQMGGSRITSIKSGAFAGLIYNQGMGSLGLPAMVRSDYDAAVFIDKSGRILNDAEAKQLTYFIDGAMTGRLKKPLDADGYERLMEATWNGDMDEILRVRREYLDYGGQDEYVRQEVLHSTHETFLDPTQGEPVINSSTGEPLRDPETGEIVIDPATGTPILGHPGGVFAVGPDGYTYIDEPQYGSWAEQQGLPWYSKWETERPTQPWNIDEEGFNSQTGSTLTYRTYYVNGVPKTFITRPDGTTIPAVDAMQLVESKGNGFRLDASNMPEAYRITGQPEATDPWGAAREAYAAQLAAGQIRSGEVYLGEDADRFINGVANQEKAADVVAVNSYGQYRLFEAKGKQIDDGLTQLRLSADKLGPEQVIRYDLVVGTELERGYLVNHDNLLTEVDADGNHSLVLIHGKPVKIHFTNTLSGGG